MKLIERTSCPLCNSKEIALSKKGTFDPQNISTQNFKITDSNYGSLWTFFSCAACGFVFSNPYIPEEEIVEFYSQLEDLEYSSEAEGRTKNFQTIIKRLKRVSKRNGASPRLLDIGAASGIFLDLANKEGFDSTGIEPSQFLVDDAKKNYGLNLYKGTVEEYLEENKGKEKFSIITLLDIIEHLVEPDAFMDKVDALIEDNGFLVLVTPDIGSLAARITGKQWWHYRIAHINFFNRKSLRFLLEKHGYDIVLKKKYVWNFSVFYLASRIFPLLKEKKSLQKVLKRLHLKLPLFDSWEIYARKRK
ncbi:MAG: class I SAM-dependent methyltransferase [bacterium]|nr:class I SAM-dependent methyltransferase [bacterium]